MNSDKHNNSQIVCVSDSISEPLESAPKGTRRLRKKNYEKINDEIRKHIIFEVTVLGNKLKSVCEKLNINVSSAKNVLAIYKKEGRIEKKKYRVKRKKACEAKESPVSSTEPEEKKQPKAEVSSIGPNNTESFVAPPQSCISPKLDINLNTININTFNVNLVFENYCMCPLTPNAYQTPMPWSISNMEQCLKTFMSMMNGCQN